MVDSTGEVYGDAPNVAARVQSAAAPGEIWITRGVHRQIAGLFVAEDKGEHELKGVAEKAQLYRIVRASGGGRRGRSRAPTPLVGRAEELDILTRRWERARRGEGQFVQIVGEPGIGKSRLVEEFHVRLGETPTPGSNGRRRNCCRTRLCTRSPNGDQRFGDAETPAGRRFADLENTLQLIGLDPDVHAPLLAPLVDIPPPPGRAADLPPEELRRRQLAAMTAWVLAGARSQPVALAFEDLHWADPTSLDLMQALAERGAQAPLFILATTRPEFRPPWSLRAHHSVISLSPLDRADVARMVGELAARHALSQEVVEGVSERTGGVPLFVEEVTRLLLERGEQGGLQAIPPTLQQSLAARLDRLGEAREVAQIGAVLGRDFSYALLAAVGGVADPGLQRDPVAAVADRGLQSALDQLVHADLLFVEGAGAQGTYRFKHALIQDAAYESLLKSRRQALHRRAAEILRNDPERAAAEPELVAHHFTEAGLDGLAIEWWGKAGDQALRRSAFQEAIAHLGKAIAMTNKASEGVQPDGPAQRLSRMRLQTIYGYALLHGRGHASLETRAAFTRARELAAGVEDAAERFSAYYGLWAGSFVRAELNSMREAGEAFLRDAPRRPGSLESAVAHRIVGTTSWFQGDYAGARVQFEQALSAYDSERDRDLASRFGYDVAVQAEVVRALVLWALGLIDQSENGVQNGLNLAAQARHSPSVAFARFYAGVLAAIRRSPMEARSHAEALLALSREHGMPQWQAHATFLLGWASWRENYQDGQARMREGLLLLREKNVRHFEPFFGALFAEVEAGAGRVEAGLATVDAKFAIVAKTGEDGLLHEMHRIRGEILLKRDPENTAPAEEAFLAAIGIAQQQKAKSFELRAALSLAKLYRSTARPADAHAVLAPALEGFSPTPEFPEIAEALALVAALKTSAQL